MGAFLYSARMAKLREINREQRFLLPPDLRDWVADDDLAHVVIAAVERVKRDAFTINHRGTGKAQDHPRLMLGLLIYGYANGLFSSRRLERATYRDVGVRFVAADQHPDHDTIAAGRARQRPGVRGGVPGRAADGAGERAVEARHGLD